ncbi:antigen UB05 [Hepatocystis sp. ex Piliocolobus tephrosceles]|nr:antigen UB05 [Hepatocystis sp. ex Piliocolobus tephrosceles]
MGSTIQPSRFLDSAVLSLFAMIISAAFLYMFSEFYLLSIETKLFNNKIAMVLSRLFPFKQKNFEYNLTHILLLTICIIILSLK